MNLFENLLKLNESNKSIDELIELAGGIDYIDNLFHEVVNEYEDIENDIDEIANFTYDRIKGNLSLDEWVSVLEYLYYGGSSKLSESKTKTYDIRFSFRGNGCCAYNRSEMQYGDYKNLAHISDDGAIKYYDSNLPEDVKNKIETFANKMKLEYEEKMKKNAEAKRKNDEFLKNRFKTESAKNEVYNKVMKEIKELKRKLKDSDIIENFGQKEIRELKDKYEYFSLVDLDSFERVKILKAIDNFEEWCMTRTTKNIKIESISKDTLWTNFNRHYNGFIPLKDLTNYFSLDQFGEFIQWCRKEADLDYDYEKRYSDWSEIYQEIYDIWFSEDVESISVENVFNFFTTSDLEEFWNWVEREYDLVEDDLEESTSGIGAGAYTTKAIDMIPTGVKKIKKVNESLYDEYLERVMDEKNNVELVNLLNEIKSNKELKAEDKRKLEDEIRTKVRTIKTEAITEFYGKEWSDEEIQKMIDEVKENPGIEFVADPDEIAHPLNYNGKDYWLIGEEKQIVFDGKDCVVVLTVDDDLKRYLTYFEYTLYDDGDGESGPQELRMDVSNVPYKIVAI